MSDGSNEFQSQFGQLLRTYRSSQVLRQVDLAKSIPVDHTVVSRWENGALFPTLGQLHTIKKELSLDEEAFEALFFAWKREAERVPEGFLWASQRPNSVLESLRTSILCSRELRKAGKPREAMLLCERDATLALERIRSFPWSQDHPGLLTALSELIVEQCKAGLDFLPRSAVRDGALAGSLKMLRRLHEAHGSDATRFFAELAMEGVTYVGGDVQTAFGQSLTMLNSELVVPGPWKHELLRAAAINAGKIRERSALEAVEQKIAEFLDSAEGTTTPGENAFLFEGLGRGWAELDTERGLGLVHEAWRIRRASRDTENHSMLRHVQLVRSEAEIASVDVVGASKSAMKKKVDQALSISREYRYDRYVAQLKKLLRVFST